MAEAFAGGIFDVDGVLVDSPHEAAWRDALRELMEGDWADIRDRRRGRPRPSRPRSTSASCRASRG